MLQRSGSGDDGETLGAVVGVDPRLALAVAAADVRLDEDEARQPASESFRQMSHEATFQPTASTALRKASGEFCTGRFLAIVMRFDAREGLIGAPRIDHAGPMQVCTRNTIALLVAESRPRFPRSIL
jgi:hypothetical protein